MLTTSFFYVNAQAPANDLCDNATQVFCGEVISGTTSEATWDSVPTCGTSNSAPGVWYSFTGTGDNITVSTCDNANFDTKISVFTDGCGFFTCVDGNDDADDCLGNTSEVSFASSLGNQYLILVHGFDQDTGSFTITITCTVGGTNDDCANAQPITCGESINGSTLGTTLDIVPTCNSLDATIGGVWYSFVGTGEQLTLTTCDNADYDTRISAYTGDCDSLICVNANDDDPNCTGFTSTLSFVTDTGITYLILVHGFDDEQGNFTLSASCGPAIPAPPNDNCDSVTATAIAAGGSATFNGTTLGATMSADEATEFGFKIVWEAFTVSDSCNMVEIRYCGSVSPTFNIFASLNTACAPGSPFLEDDNLEPDDISCGDGNLVYTFSFIPAGTYYIPVFADESFLDPLGEYTVTVNVRSCPPPSPNDDCSQAIAISCGAVVDGNTRGANVDLVNDCDGDPVEAPGVWYSITGNGDFIVLSTCNTSNYDTKINVYADGCGVLSCVAENDDGLDCAGFTSSVGFLSTDGEEYLVLVHGFDEDASGEFTMSVTCIENLLPNEICSNVTPVVIETDSSATFVGTTAGAVSDPADDEEFGAKVVWEAFTVTGDCNMIEIAYCGSVSATFNIFASLYNGCPPGSSFLTDDDGNPDDALCGDGNLTYTFSFVPAGTYYIPVFADEAFLDSLGEYTVTVSVTDCPPPSPNDSCHQAVAIACGDTVSGNTFGSTPDSAATTCVTTITSPGIWYSLIGTGDFVQLSTCGTANFDTKINVYRGDCDSLVCVTGNDDAAGCTGFTSQANFVAEAGVEYLILVHGFQQETGLFDMTVTCTPITVPNDACSGAVPVACGDVVTGTTTGATPDGLPFCGASNTAAGVWYVLTGDGSLVTASLCDDSTNYDTKIAVFSGTNCADLTCIGGNDDSEGCTVNEFFSSFSWVAEVGQTYYIVVHGFQLQQGNFGLGITCTDPLENDNCSDVTPVDVVSGPTPTIFTGTTAGAAQDAFEAAEFGFNIVWEAFTLTGTCNKNVTISYCGSLSPTFNIFARIYTDCQSNSFIEDSDGNPDDVLCGDGNLTYNFDNLAPGTYYIPVFADESFLSPLGDYTITVLAEDIVITSFTLVDADTDQDIGPLVDGDILNLNVLPNIAIRANTCGTPGSVQFQLNLDAPTNDNTDPFALTDDVAGDYNAWNATPGSYTLSATPYDGADGTGNITGAKETVNFTVIDDNCVFVEVNITTDFFGEETAWTLVDLNDGSVVGSVDAGTYADLASFRHVFCVDPTHCYEFTITDEFGDGICCFNGDGSFSVSYDGAVVGFGGAFEDEVQFSFGGGCAQEDCAGVPGGTAITDPAGTCCQPDELGCDGFCFTPAGPAVTTFTLVDATTNQDLYVLTDGAVIDLSITGPISIRADVCPDPVGSVRFGLNGTSYRMENHAFYTIGGDDNGNYHPWNVTPGTYTIRATPYNGVNGTGGAGAFLEITITIIDGTPCDGNDVRVTGFTLVSATTDTDLGALVDGAVIDLAVTGPINVRADVCDEPNVGSVRFNLNGTNYSLENIPAYTLAGDNNGNYNTWNVTPGTYTLLATPYGGDNATGTVGTPLQITFTVVNTPCLGTDRRVTSLTLVSAATEQDLGALLDGATIDLSVTGPINVRANVCDEDNIESVRFLVNGAIQATENIPFYTLAGDNNGNYSAWNVTPGTYTIRATPYAGNNATGTAGTFYEVTITIVAGGSAKTSGMPSGNNAVSETSLLAYPNPFRDQLNFEFTVAADTRVQLEIFSVSGAKIATLFEGNADGGKLTKVMFNAGELAPGIYFYRMTTNEGVITDKVMLSR